MRIQSKSWLIAVILIAVAAFLIVFQPVRIIREEDIFAHAYYTYEFEKPVGATQRARGHLTKKIEEWLNEKEVYGARVTTPTTTELKIRVDVEERAEIEPTGRIIRQMLEEKLTDRCGKILSESVTHDFPPRPIAKLGPVGIYPLQFHVRQGLDLQGGTHLVLQARKQNTLIRIELAPTATEIKAQLDQAASLLEAQLPSGKAKPASEETPTEGEIPEVPSADPPAEESSVSPEEEATTKEMGTAQGEETTAEAEKEELSEEELEAKLVADEELKERVEDAVRKLLARTPLKDYYFEVIGTSIAIVRTETKREQEREQHAQIVLGALKKVFPQAELKSVEFLKIPRNVVEQVRRIVARRVDKLGVAEAQVQTQGEDRIIVQLPGIKDPEEAIELLGTTAQLEFRKIPEKYEPEVERIGLMERTYIVDKATKAEVPTDIVYDEGEQVILGTELKPGSATVGYDQFGAPAVNLELTRTGARKFDDFAKRNFHKFLGIYLDRELISAPRINARQFGGKVMISGGFESVEEARDLMNLLNAGSLPVPVDVVEQRTVSATLGEDSVRDSYRAGLIGLTAVAVFMICFYKLPGLLALAALVIYGLLVLACLVLFEATLTLPGIFGFILSIGMAVDANVIIFERLKEELRAGRTLRAAVQAGFDRAWTAILDANVTTLLITFVLYSLGTGPIKGFAVTLSIGILASLFTAMIVTRLFLNLVAQTAWGSNLGWYRT
ncbi:MAG TPA: protein translocase subunit SecD [Armatimonadetes bacterium]|nr:protein translocase subunit SecD [Armatimonadota bacterium]